MDRLYLTRKFPCKVFSKINVNYAFWLLKCLPQWVTQSKLMLNVEQVPSEFVQVVMKFFQKVLFCCTLLCLFGNIESIHTAVWTADDGLCRRSPLNILDAVCSNRLHSGTLSAHSLHSQYAHSFDLGLQQMLSASSSRLFVFKMFMAYSLGTINVRFSWVLHRHVSRSTMVGWTTENGRKEPKKLTVGWYQRTNRPIPIIGKTADNWPIPIIGAYSIIIKLNHGLQSCSSYDEMQIK